MKDTPDSTHIQANLQPGEAPGEAAKAIRDTLDGIAKKHESPKIERDDKTDIGNSERLLALYRSRILYCATWKQWLIWRGARWAIDDSQEIRRLAKTTVQTMYYTAGNMDKDGQRQAFAAWIKRSESLGRLKAMIESAEDQVPILPTDLDANPLLFNVNNGTIHLDSGDFRGHSKADRITKIADVDYSTKAECPQWMAFLTRIFDGNDEVIRYLQRCIGWAMTADVSEQVLFFLWGTGANGKSTLLAIILLIMGDYGCQMAPETILRKRSGGIPSDVARLHGKRFVATSETGEGHKLAEELIKIFTGGDKVVARRLYQNEFEFSPTHKIFLSTNHRPEIEGTDHAIWRRIRLIPFNITIPEDEQDRDLLWKLKQELSGILRWAVHGSVEWRNHGLGYPEEIRRATEAYREEMDVMGGFFEDKCVFGEGKEAKSSALRLTYKDYCEANGEKAKTQKYVAARLKERDCKRNRREDGYYWLGVGLKNEPLWGK